MNQIILDFPTYSQLPEFDLYNDQVILVVETILKPIWEDLSTETPITPSMINNYVKKGLLEKPKKKKYNRGHLVRLLMITLMKEVFSLEEIERGMKLLMEDRTEEGAYEGFVAAMNHAFEVIPEEGEDQEIPGERMISVACAAVACKLYGRRFLRSHFIEREEGFVYETE